MLGVLPICFLFSPQIPLISRSLKMFILPSHDKDASARGPDAVPHGARLEVPQTLENHVPRSIVISGIVISH